jgi:hypothetical protein
MRVAASIALVFATALVLPRAPAHAQSTRRGAYDIRDQIKANWERKRKARRGETEPLEQNANAAGFFIPQGQTAPNTEASKAFPKFVPPQQGQPGGSDPGAGAGPAPDPGPVAPPPRTTRPPRPRVPIVPGLRAPSVRKIETEEDLEEFQKVQRVRKAASVRMAVKRAAKNDEKLTEVGLVRRVLGALDMPAPEDAEGLRKTGQVRGGGPALLPDSPRRQDHRARGGVLR